MIFRRFITGICALALAGTLGAGAAQALSVDLITNGDFESGDLSGWSTTSNSRGETFEAERGSRWERAMSGNYDVSYDPNYSGIATLTQFFTVPDRIISATLDFTVQMGNVFFNTTTPLTQVSILDSFSNSIWGVSSTSYNTSVSPVSFDITTLLQSYQGQSLGLQFGFTPAEGYLGASGDLTLDDIAMMVETPAAVPLPPTIWMMLAALGLFGFLGWKRREGKNSASFTAHPA